MAKKTQNKKTLPEQVLDTNKIDYEDYQLYVLDISEEDRLKSLDENGFTQNDIYKTLALTGDKTGPLIGVVPIVEHLDEKKLAKASGNKKVAMIPQKDLQKTTGYVHGANNPVGIWKLHNGKYPIFFDTSTSQRDFILVSAGEVGRSMKINANDVAKLIGAEFTDLVQ
jgi:Cys-tRNA(Pro)/Cys-tRNA(Cys) deacylase